MTINPSIDPDHAHSGTYERAPLSASGKIVFIHRLVPIGMALMALFSLWVYFKMNPSSSASPKTSNTETLLPPILNRTTDDNSRGDRPSDRVNGALAHDPANSANGANQNTQSDTSSKANTDVERRNELSNLWNTLGTSINPSSVSANSSNSLNLPYTHSESSTGITTHGFNETHTPLQAPVLKSSQSSAPPFPLQANEIGNTSSLAGLKSTMDNLTDIQTQGTAQTKNGNNASTIAHDDTATPNELKKVLARVERLMSTLLPRGSQIDCTLETAIDSTLPGLTTCIVAADVYSADGKVVLIDRGSQLVGETHADVKPAQSRVGVIWTDARTSDGVRFTLNSPSTDALGRTGLTGATDRHLSERLQAASLITLIDATNSALQAHFERNNSININPQTTTQVGTEGLKEIAQTPPTIQVAAGAVIHILVVQDIDFSQVYGFKKNYH